MNITIKNIKKLKTGIVLNRREKILVIAAACMIVAFILHRKVIKPVFVKRASLETKVAAKMKGLSDILALRAEYQAIMALRDTADVRGSVLKGKTLFSFLDQLAGQTGVKEKITYMKPKTVNEPDTGLKLSIVELKIQDIGIKQLTDYLYRVEHADPMIRINRLSITRGDGEYALLTVIMEVQTVLS